MTFVIFSWKWNEWMWPLKFLNWGRTEWWNVLIGIVFALVGGIFGIIHTLSKVKQVTSPLLLMFIQFGNSAVEGEGLAGSIMILCCVVPLGFVWWQAKRLNPRGGEVTV